MPGFRSLEIIKITRMLHCDHEVMKILAIDTMLMTTNMSMMIET